MVLSAQLDTQVVVSTSPVCTQATTMFAHFQRIDTRLMSQKQSQVMPALQILQHLQLSGAATQQHWQKVQERLTKNTRCHLLKPTQGALRPSLILQ